MAKITKAALHWLSLSDAVHRYGICPNSFRTYLKEMEDSGRYPEGAIIRQSRATLVLDAALHDFMRNMTSIRAGIKIPPYDGEAMRIELMRLTI